MNKDSVFMEIPREKITFYGDTESEKKLNEILYVLSLENDSLQNENKQLQNNRDNTIELIESLIIFWKKYTPDNSLEVGQLENILNKLKGDSDE